MRTGDVAAASHQHRSVGGWNWLLRRCGWSTGHVTHYASRIPLPQIPDTFGIIHRQCIRIQSSDVFQGDVEHELRALDTDGTGLIAYDVFCNAVSEILKAYLFVDKLNCNITASNCEKDSTSNIPQHDDEGDMAETCGPPLISDSLITFIVSVALLFPLELILPQKNNPTVCKRVAYAESEMGGQLRVMRLIVSEYRDAETTPGQQDDSGTNSPVFSVKSSAEDESRVFALVDSASVEKRWCKESAPTKRSDFTLGSSSSSSPLVSPAAPRRPCTTTRSSRRFRVRVASGNMLSKETATPAPSFIERHTVEGSSLTDMDSALGTSSPSLELDPKGGIRNNSSSSQCSSLSDGENYECLGEGSPGGAVSPVPGGKG
ncbi:hypothetical protein B566_EDAN010968 [Ephemera danica]|nr:hypothetical protein B566_EDAN010968 [Ephemera danica]